MTSAAGIVALTGWSYATRPPGSGATDAEAKRAARCLTHNPMTADVPSCAGQQDVIRTTVVGDRLANPDAVSSEMVFRIHLAEVSAGFSSTPAITACYRISTNHYGLAGGPTRVHCP